MNINHPLMLRVMIRDCYFGSLFFVAPSVQRHQYSRRRLARGSIRGQSDKEQNVDANEQG